MSSGFVSGGTSDQPIERDDEWLRAQQELEAERRRKAEIGKHDDGKSLFEVLERNKMAKQEAFEEKSRLKNQFRSLDDDEVEFLDSVLESTRAKEAAVKRDTAERLEAFRRQREKAEKVLKEPADMLEAEGEGEDWSAPRKRRREKQNTLFPKKHKTSTSTPAGKDTDKEGGDTKTAQKASASSQATPVTKSPGATGQPTAAQPTEKKAEAKPAPRPLVSLGLGDYGSDSD